MPSGGFDGTIHLSSRHRHTDTSYPLYLLLFDTLPLYLLLFGLTLLPCKTATPS